jgi:hypothetical protein
MKKLLVLFLCLAAVAGFVMADDYRPPGALEMPGHGVGCEAVIPDTVLTVVPLTVAEPVSFQAVMALDEGAIQPRLILVIMVDHLALPKDLPAGVDYPLRL